MFKIAVITPCYNTEKYVNDCLLSVSKSVCFGEFEYEHIVVDDGSTDKSWEIINNFNNPNLKKFRFTQNRGHSAAQNYGVAQTDAQYLMFLGADDVLFQNSLRTLALYINVNPVNWLYFDFIRGNEKLSYLLGDDYYGNNFESAKDVLVSMYKGEHFFQGNCLIKKTIFDEVNGYDETLRRAVDFDLFTKILLKGYCPIYQPGALYLHRFHRANMSKIHKDNPNLYKEDIKRFYAKYEEKLENLFRS